MKYNVQFIANGEWQADCELDPEQIQAVTEIIKALDQANQALKGTE